MSSHWFWLFRVVPVKQKMSSEPGQQQKIYTLCLILVGNWSNSILLFWLWWFLEISHTKCSSFYVSPIFWFWSKLCFIVTDLINLVVVAVWWICGNQLKEAHRLKQTARRSPIANFVWQAHRRWTAHHAQCSRIWCQDEKSWKNRLIYKCQARNPCCAAKSCKESSFPRFIERDSEAANATSQPGLCSDTKHQQRQQKWRL